jgi:hypothetical protein
VFYKDRNAHVHHLRQVFERCKKHGISLNPKTFIFGVDEGKLLGHILSKGDKIDPTRIEGIQQLPFPTNKKAIQYFFRKK